MSQGPPVWLNEERELEALLHAALDRFDRQPAEQRERDVFLPAERFLPSLARSDASADQLWSLVVELERQGVLKIRRGRLGPYDPQWKGAKLTFSADGESVLRTWLQRERTPAELDRWRAAVNASAHLFPAGCDALLARRIAIEDRSAEEIVAAFARMREVTGPITLRQLSALCFWGDSKVLDERAELVATLFPQLTVRDRAIVVAVYLPPRWEGVLFIENQDTYTAACDGVPAEAAPLALVYASGFRSTAERVRTPGGAVLHFAGPGARVTDASGAAENATNERHLAASNDKAAGVQTGRIGASDIEPAAKTAGVEATGVARFERWWFGQQSTPSPTPCWFWGDLDFAGMQILKALRTRFGDVRAWPPGYAPMVADLRRERGYSSAASLRRGQIDPLTTGCPYADEVLLPAIRERGQLDQERPASSVEEPSPAESAGQSGFSP